MRRLGRAAGEFAVVAGLKKASELSVKVSWPPHGPHHSFPVLGKRSHIQVTVWNPGVSGSDMHLRIPLK